MHTLDGMFQGAAGFITTIEKAIVHKTRNAIWECEMNKQHLET